MYTSQRPNYMLFTVLFENDVQTPDLLAATLSVLLSLLSALLVTSPLLA